MKVVSVEKLPKDVLKKAKIIGNVFKEMAMLKRALDTIDKIASINNEDEKDKVLNDIYKIAHAFSGSCKNSHKEWKLFEAKMAKKLKNY
jgi:hypothetical protein